MTIPILSFKPQLLLFLQVQNRCIIFSLLFFCCCLKAVILWQSSNIVCANSFARSEAQDAVLLCHQILLTASDSGLSLCQSSTRDSEWRAADVVQSNGIKEEDASRIASMFTTNRQRKIWIGLTTIESGKLHQPANSTLINRLEWIFWKKVSFYVLWNEDSSIVCRFKDKQKQQLWAFERFR